MLSSSNFICYNTNWRWKKKETILKKLYSGELDPTKFYEPESAEYWKEDAKVNAILTKWANKLGSDDNLEFFDEMFSIYVEMVGLEREEIFQYGFNLAVKLMSEAYSAKLSGEMYPHQRN